MSDAWNTLGGLELLAMVRAAVEEGARVPVSADDTVENAVSVPSKVLHHRRSEVFVESIARQLRMYWAKNDGIRVFSKKCDRNVRDFTVNELLFDIHVCDTAVLPISSRSPLRYVRETILQLESELEFRGSVKPQVIDFAKLVTGAAKTKVFIGGHRGDTAKQREALAYVAAMCSGRTFAFFVPHPERWDAAIGASVGVESYEYAEGEWKCF